VKLAPWDYLLKAFDKPAPGEQGFPDLYDPIWVASLALLVVAVVFYNVQMRRLHRHPPLAALQEWLLWTAISTFGLVLIATVFKFYFFIVVGTIVIGIATFVWIRFVSFPPQIEAYNNQLKRARFFSQARYRHPEATVRSRKSAGRQRRRRR
jgi:O-antigen/teichoic acid export membrane protein